MKDITLKPPRRPDEEYVDMLQDYASRRREIAHTAERAPDKNAEDFVPGTTALSIKTGDPVLTEGFGRNIVKAGINAAKDFVDLNPKAKDIGVKKWKDKKGNEHSSKVVKVGNRTYSVDGSGRAVEYDADRNAPKTIAEIQKEESDRRKKAAGKLLATGVIAAGTLGYQAYREHKKKKEAEAARKKAEEDAYNSRIDVRVKKALEGNKDNGKRGKKSQNESAQSDYESDITALKSKYAHIGAESGVKVLKDFKKENPKAYKDLRNRVIKGGVSYVKTNAGPALHEYREIRRKYKRAKKAEKEMEEYVQESVSMMGVLESAVNDFAYRTSAGIS